MNGNETAARTRDGWAGVQWNARRTKLAGGGAILGGIAGLTISGPVNIPFGRLGSNPDFGLLGVVYPSVYLLFAVSLVAAASHFDPGPASSGRNSAVLLAAAVGAYAGSLFVIVGGNVLFGEVFVPAGVVTGFAYLAVRFLGTLYGLRLWQQGRSNKVTAGLFLSLFPALFVFGLLTTVGVPASTIDGVVYLAFLALGIELVRSAPGTPFGEEGRER